MVGWRRRATDPGVGPAGAPAAASPPVPPPSERLHAFRSLGGNCEFGFVQRYGGAEPSGLLRFSYTPLDDLIHALDTGLGEYGVPGDLRIEAVESGAYYCASRRYGIWSNTAQAVGTIDPDALLAREYGRAAHLKGKMLRELADGSRILVRKVSQGETEADLDRLARAVWRHGPSTLLWVSEGGAERPEPVRRLSDRVLAGRVPRFAPNERAWDVDLEPWLHLCDGAYALHRGLPGAALHAVPPARVLSLPAGLRRHRGPPQGGGLSAFTRAVDPAGFDPTRVYVFSTWVWIPARAACSRVFATVGHDRLRGRDADLAVRDRWQRVWAAGRFRHGEARAPVGLAMIGDGADRFWSWGAQFHEGPVPPPAEPPAPIVPLAALGWVGNWRRRAADRPAA